MDLNRKQLQFNFTAWILRAILISAFAILIGRLLELQIIKGGYFHSLSEGNRIRRIAIIAPRGKIYARGGETLVDNEEIVKCIIFNSESGYGKEDVKKCNTTDGLISEYIRKYPLGTSFAHVSGYVGSAGESELGKVDPKSTEKGVITAESYVGRTGLEEQYDYLLRGIDGEELIEVDSKGEEVRVLGKKDPIPGHDLYTSIDYKLQMFVSKLLLTNERGAIIVTDAHGEVLALYSSPSYDPNIFVSAAGSDQLQKVLNDNNYPLFNRAISGVYHPGSTYKPIVAIAALEDKTIDANFTYNDTGRIILRTPYGVYTYNNWYYTQYGGTEGNINLERALTRSTDTFFYKIGEMEGVDGLVSWSRRFNLDNKTGIDLPGENKGLIPSPQWKETVKGEKWFLGNTYHMSIGQGDIALTPIALNQAISSIANGGIYCKPHIVSPESSDKQFFLGEDIPGQCESLNISRESIEEVKEGMTGVCSQGGTAYTFFDFSQKNPQHYNIACKTGTAETGVNDKSHAWLTAFAPVDFPEIVVTVLVEEGGEGSSVAGPIARQIFDEYFK